MNEHDATAQSNIAVSPNGNGLNRFHTFAGILASELTARLAAPLPPTAYRAVPGGADLTDINTGHMIERLTEVFGPAGLGWWIDWPVENVELVETGRSPWVIIKKAELAYILIDDKGEERLCRIPCTGGNMNATGLQYAFSGAVTSVIGSGAKLACFQLPVYKGELDHHNAGSRAAKTGAKVMEAARAARAAAKVEGNGDGRSALTLEAARAVVLPTGTKDHPECKGKTLGQIEDSDPGFVDWVSGKAKNADLKAAAAKIVAARKPTPAKKSATPASASKPSPNGNGKLSLTQARAVVMLFAVKGRHKDETLGTIEDTDPGVIDWLAATARKDDLKAAAATIAAARK